MKKTVPADAVLVPDNAEKVFEGQIFNVYQWPQALFDGTPATFEMLKRPDTVSAICVVDGQLLVLEEEQPHSGRTLSFAGGRVDPGDESVLSAAKREVHEETGYDFKQWRLISVKQPHTKIEWFIHIFLAWDVASISEPHIDAGEKIELKFLSFEEVKKLSQQGVKYLNESQELFGKVNGVEELLKLPEFSSKEVDR